MIVLNISEPQIASHNNLGVCSGAIYNWYNDIRGHYIQAPMSLTNSRVSLMALLFRVGQDT